MPLGAPRRHAPDRFTDKRPPVLRENNFCCFRIRPSPSENFGNIDFARFQLFGQAQGVIPPENQELCRWNFLGLMDEEISMKKSRFTDAEVMAVLRQGEGGMAVPELCRQHGIGSAGSAARRTANGVPDMAAWTLQWCRR